MSGLPDVLKIPDGPDKLSLLLNNLPVSSLIKFQLPPQRKSTVFADPTEHAARAKFWIFAPFLAHFVTWFWIFVHALDDP